MDDAALERYARMIHAARESVNAERKRPFILEPWERRTAEQREQDIRAASAVAAAVLAGYEAERAELTRARLSRSVTIARIRALCRGHLGRAGAERGSVCCPHLAEDILAIAGSEEARPKLVRDKIPALIRSRGLEPVTRTAGEGEMPALLRDKLREETGEYLTSGDPAELADVLEIVHALAGLAGITAERLESMRAAKAEERGTFAGRVVWSGNIGSEEENQ